MEQARQRTPDWLLERIALEELPAAKLQAARLQLESEPDGQARLEELQASNREILGRIPPADVSLEVTRRFERIQKRENISSRRLWVLEQIQHVLRYRLHVPSGEPVHHPEPDELAPPTGYSGCNNRALRASSKRRARPELHPAKLHTPPRNLAHDRPAHRRGP